MKRKFGFKHYFQPTPKRVRIFGDSLAAASTLGASIAILNGHALVGTIMMVAGWTGKFISNFFTDLPEENETPKKPKTQKVKP